MSDVTVETGRQTNRSELGFLSLLKIYKDTVMSFPDRRRLLVFGGVVGLVLVLAISSWLSFAAAITQRHGGVLAGSMSVSETRDLLQLLDARGVLLPYWRPFLGVLVYTPLTLVFGVMAALALRRELSGLPNALRGAVSTVRGSALRLVRLGLPLAFLSLIGAYAMVVNRFLSYVEQQTSNVRNDDLLGPLIQMGLPNPISRVTQTMVFELTAWSWALWILTSILFVIVLVILGTRLIPAVDIWTSKDTARWTEVRSGAIQGKLFARVKTREFWVTIGAAFLLYVFARLLLWLLFLLSGLFGLNFAGLVFSIVVVVAFAASAMVLMAAGTNLILDKLPTKPSETETR
ncbi:MAG: hypothetical protein AAGI36_20335 [Pseudomonadota bacterium]